MLQSDPIQDYPANLDVSCNLVYTDVPPYTYCETDPETKEKSFESTANQMRQQKTDADTSPEQAQTKKLIDLVNRDKEVREYLTDFYRLGKLHRTAETQRGTTVSERQIEMTPITEMTEMTPTTYRSFGNFSNDTPSSRFETRTPNTYDELDNFLKDLDVSTLRRNTMLASQRAISTFSPEDETTEFFLDLMEEDVLKDAEALDSFISAVDTPKRGRLEIINSMNSELRNKAKTYMSKTRSGAPFNIYDSLEMTPMIPRDLFNSSQEQVLESARADYRRGITERVEQRIDERATIAKNRQSMNQRQRDNLRVVKTPAADDIISIEDDVMDDLNLIDTSELDSTFESLLSEDTHRNTIESLTSAHERVHERLAPAIRGLESSTAYNIGANLVGGVIASQIPGAENRNMFEQSALGGTVAGSLASLPSLYGLGASRAGAFALGTGVSEGIAGFTAFDATNKLVQKALADKPKSVREPLGIGAGGAAGASASVLTGAGIKTGASLLAEETTLAEAEGLALAAAPETGGASLLLTVPIAGAALALGAYSVGKGITKIFK